MGQRGADTGGGAYMVVMIRRMLVPLIRKYFRLFLSMIVVSCLGIALMAGLSGAFYALENGFSD